MRRLLLVFGVLAGSGVAAVAAVPTVAARVAAERGVQVGRASWCDMALCFTNVRRGSIVAMSGRVGTDRVLTLSEVLVRPSGTSEAPTADPMAGVDLGPIRQVRVENLSVEGLPLPPLSGEVWPNRLLDGDGVHIDGDTVTAGFDTEHGRVEATVTREDGALVGTASCACTVKTTEGARFSGDVEAEGRYDDGRFEGRIVVNGLRADVTATREDAGAIRANFTLVDQPIAGVYALFGGMVPELRDAQIEGTVSATGSVSWPEVDLVVKPVLSGFMVDGLVSPAYQVGTYSYPIRTREELAGTRTTGPMDPSWLGLQGMGPYLPAAVIAAEDARFRVHPGYDVDGMLDAARANRAAGKIERGGSTMTQQLAKNLFLDGERSYARKLRELLYAVELERELGKMRILETYLNVVEFGPGVYGARAAATAFFSKSPAGLLPEEAAYLAAILKYPRTAWKTQYERGTAHRVRVDKILDNMRDLPPEERAAAKAREIVLVPGG